ncbi:MAG: translation initiation factor IF-2 [Anaerolineales bacterium]|nr:translation initiation factor IF-2 [Anaerolineales bacterium]
MSENGHKVVEIPETITVRELAERIQVSPIDIIKQLMANGVMANINQLIDFDTAAIVMEELGFEAKPIAKEEEEVVEEEGEAPRWRRLLEDEEAEELETRPPVVTILGHVDHGKTTLLDAIRETNVAGGEAGGITQHIAAYQIKHNDRLITFLDTPGHEAFTSMRARGAQGADIAILVVAADDGVMPQTKEAISHAKAAKVPIVVALNKMDREQANPDRVKQQLSDEGLIPDEWEGDTMVVPVSATEQTGLEDLMEAILLTADATEIVANPDGETFGTVIEGEVDPSRGVVATLLVQNGVLNAGDTVLAGSSYGRIRAMFDYQGNSIEEAGPSTPVSMLGLSDVPQAGELFRTVESESDARDIVEDREAEAEMAEQRGRPVRSLEQIFESVQAGDVQELRLVIKADVQGSLEPITSSVENLSTDEVTVNVLQAATGNIGKNDVMLAAASDAIVLGFNVSADDAALKSAEVEGVEIRHYNVIYRLIEDVEKAVKGMLEPEAKREVIGRAEVRAVFDISRVGKIAGCRVLQGEIRRNAKIAVVRDKKIIHEGPISSLKHEKDDVREVREGFECGINVKGFEAFEQGDILECFVEEKVPVA